MKVGWCFSAVSSGLNHRRYYYTDFWSNILVGTHWGIKGDVHSNRLGKSLTRPRENMEGTSSMSSLIGRIKCHECCTHLNILIRFYVESTVFGCSRIQDFIHINRNFDTFPTVSTLPLECSNWKISVRSNMYGMIRNCFSMWVFVFIFTNISIWIKGAICTHNVWLT